MADISDKLARGFAPPGGRRNRFTEADEKLAVLEGKEPEAISTAPPHQAAPPSRKIQSSVIRDIVSMPAEDYALIEQIRSRCLDNRVVVGKSEAVRLALRAAVALSDAELTTYAASLQKTRPGKRRRK